MANPKRYSISSVDAQLGSPAVHFHSFWTVYNTLRNAADSDIFSSCTVDEPKGKNASEGGADIVRLPPSSLCKRSPSLSQPLTVQHGSNADLSLYFPPRSISFFSSPLDRPEVSVEFTKDDTGIISLWIFYCKRRAHGLPYLDDILPVMVEFTDYG